MTVLSPGQIYAYARGAGFTGGAAVEATAVALAESSGDSAATSRNPDGGTNVGLMQLDTPGGKGAGYSVAQLQDPATNMAVAYKGWTSDGHTFTKSWETANNGAANAQLSTAQKAAGGSVGSSIGDFFAGAANQATSGPDILKPLTLTEQAGKILAWISTPANWGRVGLVVVGGAVVLVGLAKLTQPVTAPIVRTAKKGAALAAI